ncbi:MAG: DNA replication/repair protein RecF [Thermoflexales bacterium]|nr:DNA replication/repair protein RecF [Thermoflexales bacterium]
MIVRHLSLTSFRNYARLELELPAGPILLLGDNAQGKTSLLEAIYYLATAHSPHTSSDRQLIHWLAGQDSLIPAARVAGEVAAAGRPCKIDITLALEPTANSDGGRFRKQIKINDVPRKAADLAGRLMVVLFLPQDVEVVGGSPGLRRQYMDDLLCQVDGDYAQALSTYRTILSQRNALLKQLAERGGDPDELGYWNGQLIQAGTTITLARCLALAELEGLADPIHRDLTGGSDSLQLEYQPSLALARPPAPEFQIALPLQIANRKSRIANAEAEKTFAAQLQEQRAEEIARGVTLVGPHRDELRFRVDGIDLGIYGSRGQQRTAILALKLAEVEWMKARSGDWPVLLLDEVLAELDARRRAYLLARVNGAQQSVLTSTDPELFSHEFRSRARLLRVAMGQVEELGE